MKKIIAVIIAAIMLLGITPAFADAPAIEKIEYEGSGRVEVDFSGSVKYKNCKVKVTDENGTAYSARITDRDSDEISFKVANIKAGTTYRVVISGVKRRGTADYGKVKASFTTPKAASCAPAIEDIEVNANGRIEVDFKDSVQYKNLSVKVKDAGGRSYSVSVLKKDDDEINLKARGLKAGTAYTLVISGIRKKGAVEYVKLKAVFTTPASAAGLRIKKVESDASDGEIEVEFNKDVEYGSLKVTVVTASGKTLVSSVIDRDEDSVEIRVSGLVAGERYAVKVGGVRRKGSAGAYKELSCTFTAGNN